MEIKFCERCQQDWCYRGSGRPVRCGRCKSPYWDRERNNDGKASSTTDTPPMEPKDQRPAMQGVRARRNQRPSTARVDGNVRSNPEASGLLTACNKPGHRSFKNGDKFWCMTCSKEEA